MFPSSAAGLSPRNFARSTQRRSVGRLVTNLSFLLITLSTSDVRGALLGRAERALHREEDQGGQEVVSGGAGGGEVVILADILNVLDMKFILA